MNRKESLRFRRILEAHRGEGMRFLDRIGDEMRALDYDGPKDVGDLSITGMSKESLLEESSRKHNLLSLIESALHRLAAGTFGVCLDCGHQIGGPRLAALPWTRYCLRCQERTETEYTLRPLARHVASRHPQSSAQPHD
jgi:DnaK suppressor protein